MLEISDMTLRYDGRVKMPLYARNGIVEYWLVNVRAGTVTCHALPGEEGYARVTTHVRGETMSPDALPECRVRVDDLM